MRHLGPDRATRSKNMILASTVLLVCSGAGVTAYGAPVKPVGTYSEAKLETVPVKAPSAAPASSAPVSKVAPVPKRKKAEPKTVTAEVKDWVEDKWKSVKSTWFGKDKTKSQPQRGVVARPSGGAPTKQPGVSAPSRAIMPQGQGVQAVAPPSPGIRASEIPGIKHSESGVAVYDLSDPGQVPRIALDREVEYGPSRFALNRTMQKVMDQRIVHPFPSPDVLTQEKFAQLSKVGTGIAKNATRTRDVVFSPKGKVSRAGFDKITMGIKPEVAVQLRSVKPLNEEDMRFLSGLLLYQQGDKCPVAVGLFHKLSKSRKWRSEADYYLAMCSKILGLETDFMDRTRRILESENIYYSRKILKEITHEIPYEFTDSIGKALYKVSLNKRIMQGLEPGVMANIAYLLAEYGASTKRYKTTIHWAPQVPAKHPRYLQAKFLHALAEYQVGSKDKALKIQEELIGNKQTDQAKIEFQALVALNVGRMHFQERSFKGARDNFLKVYKDHPLWFQSLTEMGWAQIMSGDYEGAIGNMYSIQSPFFASVYKPESFVIRTIGYLSLCQYGDAYKTLSVLEHQYRPQLEKITEFVNKNKNGGSYYQTVRNYLRARDLKEVDGLPAPVIREMARHRDFINLQKALNRQIDEKDFYARLDGAVEKDLRGVQAKVTQTRQKIEQLRKNLGMISVKPELATFREKWTVDLEMQIEALNGHFFYVDLFKEAKAVLPAYRKDVIGGVQKRVAKMKNEMEKVLSSRLDRMKRELALILDNNELLRYEVFAGSGENIRYQVAGGENGNRVPASIIPKSKSLQWNFDGEYWEDEIGHYRSSLKNNCPESERRDQANLDGGVL